MKNRFFCHVILLIASPLSLQACLYDSPEALRQAYSLQPLSSIEQALVTHRIKKKGIACVSNPLHDPRNENRIGALEFKKTFYKNKTDTLTAHIFNTIENIEKNSPDRSASLIPHNYLGIGTKYDLKEQGNTVTVHAILFNKKQLLEICNSFKS